MFGQLVADILGVFVPEFQVNAALTAFTRIAKKLEAASKRMERHIARSYHRTDVAFDRYHVVAKRESRRRIELTTAIDQAKSARQKILDIVG